MEDYEKLVELKDGRKIKLNYLSKRDLDSRYFEEIGQYDIVIQSRIYVSHQIIANSETGQKIGSCCFNIFNSVCDLCLIEVYDQSFINSGVGTLMLKELEQIAVQEKCIEILGEFFPFGEFKDYAENFYNRNGYKISKKDELVQKFLQEKSNKSSVENGNQPPQNGE